jgi:uncharacterized membrane protein
MSELLVMAVLVLGVLLADTRRRLARLERQAIRTAGAAARVGDAGLGRPVAEAMPETAGAPIPPAPRAPSARAAPGEPLAPAGIGTVSAALPEPRPPRRRRSVRFEDLAGKQLPIWVGGVALACAAFFLVRYSIELGLFGPGTRCLLAALFGLVLLALAEFGPRLPKLGRSFADDRRLAQSLAGAGIATLYATLYMAADLYGLLGIAGGFVLVLAITGAALALALRHGPPTALLGLAGGYLAPLLAGLPDSSVPGTVVYLATFTIALLALALHRGWRWLAWCASAAGLGWTVLLLALAEAGERGTVAALVLALAVAASTVLARAGLGSGARSGRPWPVLPLVAGMVQLAAFAALAEFSALAWAFYVAISAAAIVLARRQPEMLPAVWAALAIAATAVAGSFLGEAPDPARFAPPLVFAALFGGAGQWFAFRGREGRTWAALGAVAPGLMLAASAWFAADAEAGLGWGLASLVAALPAAAMAWRADRRGASGTADVGVATTMAAAMAAAGFVTPDPLLPLAWSAIAAALAWWRMRHDALHGSTGLVILGLTALAMLREAGGLAEVPWRALAGERFHYQRVPGLGVLFVALALPGGLLVAAGRGGLALRRKPATPARLRAVAPAALSALALPGVGVMALAGFVYALAKQPLAIADPQAFVGWGFVERALITQALFAGGWLLLCRAALRSPAWVFGAVLAGVALFRFVWFDVLVLNPLAVRQALVGVPLVNPGTLHGAGVAVWLWALAGLSRGWAASARAVLPLRLAAFAATIATCLVTVRQAVHGPIVAGQAVSTTENYLFSAGLLLLAIAWLTWGIRQGQALGRIAGLALLTAVTLKVFLVDAAALGGLLRVLSFLGLGAALIGIGWVYGRVGPGARAEPSELGTGGSRAGVG